MKKLIILLAAYNICAVNYIELLRENAIQILGCSITADQLNDNLLKFSNLNPGLALIIKNKSLDILFSYLNHKFEYNFLDFAYDIKNKGDLYYRYIEPLIFISRNLGLKVLLNLFNNIGINTNINTQALYTKYDILDIISAIKSSNDPKEIKQLNQKLYFLLKLGLVNYKKITSALIDASSKRDIDLVKLLIYHGADVNIKSAAKDTPIIKASCHGDIDIVKLLINHGANVNAKNLLAETAIIFAAKSKNINLIKLLINSGTNIDVKDINGMPVIFYLWFSNKLKFIKYLILQGVNLDMQYKNGATLLMCEVRDGNNKRAKLLISNGANTDLQDINGNTALIFASLNFNTDGVKILLNANSNINIQNKYGETALILIMQYDPSSKEKREIIQNIAKLLIDKDPISALTIKDASGNTALNYAILHNYKEIIKLLEEHAKLLKKTKILFNNVKK